MSIQNAEARKNNAFTRMQSIYELSKKISDENIKVQFLQKAKTIQIIRQEFVESLEKFHELSFAADNKHGFSYAALNSFDDMYAVVNSVYSNLEEKRLQSRKPVEAAVPVVQPRLPKLQIPDFSGRQEDWPVFYQLFKRLVHDNKNISKLEKINYLVTHLQGSAKSICCGILPTEENYDALFASLIERYEDKRALASSYLDKLLFFKNISSESEAGLTTFLDKFVEATTALKHLELPDLCDFIITHIALKKLDPFTVKQFEMNYRKDDIPTFELLVQFVKEQTKILNRTQHTKSVNYQVGKNESNKKTHSFMIQKSQEPPKPKLKSGLPVMCNICKEKEHPFYFCTVFQKMTVPERWNVVKRHNACFNCLSPKKHSVSSCQSSKTCSKCGKRHHSMLHNVNISSGSAYSNQNISDIPNQSSIEIKSEELVVNKPSSADKDNENAVALVHCASSVSDKVPHTVLLATASVLVFNRAGNPCEVRALLDPGSQSHFISKETCQRLNLNLNKTDLVIKGIGSKRMQAQYATEITIKSKKSPHPCYDIEAIVVDQLTDHLPITPVGYENLPHLNNLILADPLWHTPGKIHLLLGAELWPIIMGTERVRGPPNTPVALDSSLGYILLGKTPLQVPNSISHNFCSYNECELTTAIQKFWTLEEIPSRKIMLPEEVDCENQFLENYSRLPDGRFMVALPFKCSSKTLGSSKELSIAKFRSLENRFLRNPDFHLKYKNVIQEYHRKGYITPVSENEKLDLDSCFLPHHGVIKEDSTTTPLRIVFNASARTSNGSSLNEILHVGPKLHANIFDLLLNFRLFKFALTTDISQMYLQILIHPKHRKLQRFVWRSTPSEKIQYFELNRVTFGISSSPYLALRVIKLLATLEEKKFPMAAIVAQRDTYIDDIVTSINSAEEAVELFHQLNGLFNAGGFSLAKWCTNSPRLRQQFPESDHDISFDDTTFTKVLGLRWLPSSDNFTYKLQPPQGIITKRSILSTIAKIFDPLGLVAPIVTYAKLIMKALWEQHLDWDETPHEDILKKWNCFISELSNLSQLKIPRHCFMADIHRTILVGFADACEKAYGAVIYVWSESLTASAKVRLLCAKSKIAPSKSTITIPRLELCATLLLSRLMRHVLNLFENRQKFDEVVAFSDSTVVLHWIKSSPARYKVFIANRISQLQENLNPTCWRHVKGEDNPADCLSRGVSPSALLNNPLWLYGPNWLSHPPNFWPTSFAEEIRLQETFLEIKESLRDQVIQEERQSLVASASFVEDTCHPMRNFINRFSSYTRLLRSTVYVMRFKSRDTLHRQSPITAQDLDRAEIWLVQIVQQEHFGREILSIQNQKDLSPQSPIKKLRPFLDNGILRVGGRLPHSSLSYQQKHPYLLPKKDHLVNLLIDEFHEKNFHTGPSLVLSLLRQKFWILSARGLVRSRLRSCNFCFKRRPQIINPLMGDLPAPRVNQSKPFLHTGVDYAGPFLVSWSRRRGVRPQKAYLCLFVCFSTKAVHLELASDLSTQVFMCAFKRFVARRGPVQTLYSDCGTHFIGAKAQLSELYSFIQSKNFVDEFGTGLSLKGIEWKLNPPSAPHFGGLWESAVKSAKTHLYKIINNTILSFEEFSTVLAQIEALLNSRPLFALSTDPSEPAALTPAHFLLQQPLSELPASDVTSAPLNHLTRYEYLDRLVQDFWKRWHLEYLHTMQTREKWTTVTASIKPGTLVIIKQDNWAPMKWPLGIIESCFPGPDNIVRVVTVRTKNGVFKRPVAKLCPLPSQ